VGAMTIELELAKYTIFDREALGARNFKLYPGSSRETTPERIAHEINRSIANITSGNVEFLEDSDLD